MLSCKFSRWTTTRVLPNSRLSGPTSTVDPLLLTVLNIALRPSLHRDILQCPSERERQGPRSCLRILVLALVDGIQVLDRVGIAQSPDKKTIVGTIGATVLLKQCTVASATCSGVALECF